MKVAVTDIKKKRKLGLFLLSVLAEFEYVHAHVAHNFKNKKHRLAI